MQNLKSLFDWLSSFLSHQKALEPISDYALFWELAHAHRLINIFAVASQPVGPASYQEKIRIVRELGVMREKTYFTELGRLIQILERHNIRYEFLKGAYLIKNVYPKPGMRQFGDFDIYIDEVDTLGRCLEDLVDAQYFEHLNAYPDAVSKTNAMKKNWQFFRDGNDALNLEKNGVHFEIHRSIIPRYLVSMDRMKWTPTMHYLHLLINASRHHFSMGLSFLLDLQLLENTSAISSDELLIEVQKYDLWPFVTPSAQIAKYFYQSEVLTQLLKSVPKKKWLLEQYMKASFTFFEHPSRLEQVFRSSPLIFILTVEKPVKKLIQVMWDPSKLDNAQSKTLGSRYLKLWGRIIQLILRHCYVSLRTLFWLSVRRF